MNTPGPSSATVERFARLAERFCALVDDRAAMPSEELLRRVHALLPTLYSAALDLSAVEAIDAADEEDADERDLAGSAAPPAVESDRLGRERWTALYRSLGELIGARSH